MGMDVYEVSYRLPSGEVKKAACHLLVNVVWGVVRLKGVHCAGNIPAGYAAGVELGALNAQLAITCSSLGEAI